MVDLVSSVLLFAAAAVYLIDAHNLYDANSANELFSSKVLQSFGSFGLMLKWLGMLGYLDSFQGVYSSHVHFHCSLTLSEFWPRMFAEYSKTIK